jgi:hypothetical protein
MPWAGYEGGLKLTARVTRDDSTHTRHDTKQSNAVHLSVSVHPSNERGVDSPPLLLRSADYSYKLLLQTTRGGLGNVTGSIARNISASHTRYNIL